MPDNADKIILNISLYIYCTSTKVTRYFPGIPSFSVSHRILSSLRVCAILTPQAVQAGNMVFVSGQLPIDPATGEFAGDDIKSQTRQSLTNVKNILASEGVEMSQILRVGVFMKDMNMFADMNAVYGEFFEKDFPARAAVEVARLPKDALVEIEAVACTDK